MAKISPGTMIGDARGSLGSVVFTRDRGGLKTRARVKPTQPRTIYQRATRSSWTSISQAWNSTLTDAQRFQWLLRAQQLTWHDTLGRTIPPTGKWLYLRLNQQLTTAGLPPNLANPPFDLSVTWQGPLTGAQNITTAHLTVTPATPPGGAETVILRATPGLNPGRNNITKWLRVIYTGPITPGPDLDFTAAYSARFPTQDPPHNIWVDVRYLNTTTGSTSTPTRAKIPLTLPTPGVDVMLQQKITLTSAQLLSLATTPILAIPAPGTNQVINVHQLCAYLHFGTTPYTVPGGANLQTQYAATPGNTAFAASLAGWLAATADALYAFDALGTGAGRGWGGAPYASQNPPTNYVNQALYISATANPTLGDGTLTIVLDYTIDPTT